MTDSQQGLKEVLRALLAEVQHLRVDQAVLLARQSPSATAHDLLDIEKAAKRKAVKDTESLLAKIEALA
jgi:hypothetical protein